MESARLRSFDMALLSSWKELGCREQHHAGNTIGEAYKIALEEATRERAESQDYVLE